MFKYDPEIYNMVAAEIEKETRQFPLYAQVDAFVHLLGNMPDDEFHEIVEEERNRLE